MNLRIALFLAMALAGILTIALIVAADDSYAGIDGLRAIRAFVGQKDGDPINVARIPFLGGIASAIHDVAPQLFDPAPPEPVNSASAAPSASASPQPTDQPGAAVSPAPSSAPVARPTAPTPGLTTIPAPRPSPTPSGTTPPASAPPTTPAPTAPPSATPAPTPTPAPTASPTLAVSTDRGAAAIVSLADLVPGDSLDRTITVRNDGTLSFRYTVAASQTASTLLWTDGTNGLQLTVRSSGGAVLYSGALSGLGVLSGPTILATGSTETLRYTFDFPASASNAFQGLVQDLVLVFDAVEYP